MRIKLFKLFEGRSSELTEQDFVDLLNNNCKDFIKNPTILQRNKNDNDNKRFYSINPKAHIRTSMILGSGTAGVKSNHGTLLMDNLYSWSKYPKRSQSLIGMTDYNSYDTFGKDKFFIIPFDGAKFGVCPGSDLWGVKSTLFYNHQYSFDDRLSEMFTGLGVSDKSYDEMMNDFQKVHEFWINGNDILNKNEKSISYRAIEIFTKMSELGYKDVKDGLSDIFDPKNFKSIMMSDNNGPDGFECLDYNGLLEYKLKYVVNGLTKKEFWTDSECLLLRIDSGLLDPEELDIKSVKDQFKYQFSFMIDNYIKKSDS